MPRNGSGTYSLPELPFTPGTTISSSAVNSDFSDIASALTGSIAADGQTPITASIKFASGSTSAPSIAFTTDTNTGLRHGGSGQINFVSDGADVGYINADEFAAPGTELLLNSGAVATPVGMVIDYAGSTAPDGWLFCYGQVVAQADYPELYAALGTTYDTGGEGAGNFRLPDARGRVGVGRDDMGGSAASRITTAGSGVDGAALGANGGAQSIQLTALQNGTHTHTASVSNTSHSHNVSAGGFAASTQAPGLGGTTRICVTGAGADVAYGGTFITDPTALSTIAVTIDNNGSGDPHINVQPSIIFNKIIFTGRVV